MLSNYEYPKIGTVLAEFNSIFNVLIILGLFGNLLSEYMMEIDLEVVCGKYYYGKTYN